ncbi:hypothetical protein Rhein_3240 [Rheinheimera sp. A13L]|uniref:hypothetical protein n=1 Tax=Rheinheimera sp. A13L TaxID=506534 RepID=UPI00021256FF|nr:hypothetical protein [Rheinheimera sp. A13L]EGM76674.1 hypothetical protein Rhein_3240 [Rheinheimera sp. A13L]
MLRNFFNLFRRGDNSFTELEIKILKAVEAKLSENVARIFLNRIDSVNLIQRTNDLQEVNCYEMYKGKALLRTEHQMSNVSGEFKMASFCILNASEVIISGDIWSVDGVFFSIEFSEPPLNIIWNDSYQILVDIFYKK